ncbi:restriction endonuclease subunit S [Salinimonas iocasae]|uniref:Restriction endonuclease subunit S n=1 Tax=Salinimonas iocasae TaxID=2572577 RepID=A0A5B7YF44_9ALTE|nr:restriction endonuclease subunit S [Salinimonas iocasae]QCZ94372.1 restriction endonuclease subunit S [Salinimonas iocasae]
MAEKYQRYPEYKDSGINWIGYIPSDWYVGKLKHTFKVVNGSTPSSSVEEYWDGDIPWITPADMEKSSNSYLSKGKRNISKLGLSSCGASLVSQGSIIVSSRAPIGSLAIASSSISTNQGCKSLDSYGDDNRFYFYWLKLSKLELENLGKGTTFLELSSADLANFYALKPSKKEQILIADFLDHETAKIDALIAKQEKLIELLKEKRQAVISHAVTKGLNPDVPMKDSGIEWIGEVPEHWEVVRIKHTAKSIIAGPFGSSITKDMYVPSGFKVYGQEHAIANSFDVGDYYINEQNFNILKRYSIASGDLILSCVGTFGKVSVVPTMFEAGIINPRLMLIRPSSVVASDYLAKFMQSDVSYKQFEVLSRGGTMGVINIGILSDIFIALPPLDEQNKIKELIESQASKYDKLIKKATSSISLLKERKISLISAAVTGKIDVRHWHPTQTEEAYA